MLFKARNSDDCDSLCISYQWSCVVNKLVISWGDGQQCWITLRLLNVFDFKET